MARLALVLPAFAMVAAAVACDGRQCDSEARTVCDSSASGCVSQKCGGMQDDEYVQCFEVLCVPDLCSCLDGVGCAWQEPLCDDLVTD